MRNTQSDNIYLRTDARMHSRYPSYTHIIKLRGGRKEGGGMGGVRVAAMAGVQWGNQMGGQKPGWGHETRIKRQSRQNN